MRILYNLYVWLMKRLPRRFSVPLVFLFVAYLLFVFPLLTYHAIPFAVSTFAARARIIPIPTTLVTIGSDILSALLTILFFLVGLIASYDIAAWVYRLIRKKRPQTLGARARQTTTGRPEPTDNPLKDKSIGIILAGGGAKGAYQAGAMKAIYEFLEERQALDNVRMIAGTSIGSWNALFWLAGMVRGDSDTPGPLERWWSEMSIERLFSPEVYWPLRRNYFLSSQPWQEDFDALFSERNPDAYKRLRQHIDDPAAPASIHFYLTRSNVGNARLEFTTNRADLGTVKPNMPGEERPRKPVPEGTWKQAKALVDIRTAVFASMDLPPLFPYTLIEDSYFEDGGVIDNLPIRFGTEIEGCDLIFVLPLNASFDDSVDLRSIVRRISRVINVRQGVLERNSFKMIYLYNELASLRDELERRPDVKAEEQLTGEERAVVSRALSRRHKPVQVFAICPAPQLTINTTEFWKATEAGQAFRLMHRATAEELNRFDFLAAPSVIRMALVAPQGAVTYLEDF